MKSLKGMPASKPVLQTDAFGQPVLNEWKSPLTNDRKTELGQTCRRGLRESR